MDDYYMALGKFVHCFAQVESTIHINFWRFAGIDAMVANTIKRQTNASSLIAIIRNLMEVNDFTEEDREEFDDIANQFGNISAFRDLAIHRGAKATENGDFQSDNWATARSKETLEIMSFDLDSIKKATQDLQFITLRIFALADKDEPMEEGLAVELYQPWRYRHVQPSKPHQPPQKKKPIHQRPPPASHE